jgi:kinesin family protein 2/24
MFVRATRIQAGNEKSIIAMLLCPEGSMQSNAPGAKTVRNGRLDWKRYICAAVTPAILNGAYDVNIQRQIVVSIEDMEEEVLIEYDSATRYHFLRL